jgi:hypothetical protein
MFAITQHLQLLVCLLGQFKVFAEASEILKATLGIDICAPQIQRVCEYYGSIADKAIEKNIEHCIPKIINTSKEDNVYVMVDGAMLFTREEKWKEIKLARVFNETKNIPTSEKRNEIVESIYISHLGGVDAFFPKLERHLTPYKKKVIIGDGAKWIWNWAEDNYPGATQVLDFYHAREKLVYIGQHFIKNESKRKKWIEEQSNMLLQDGIHKVIGEISKLRSPNQQAKNFRERVLNYYEMHEDRMLYKTYRDKGLLIGSGPIEAAHRSVIQNRLKLSGQKWTIKGANAIANLRCFKKSNAWHIIEKFIKAAA